MAITPGAKVTPGTVREMRRRWDNRRTVKVTQSQLAKEYGIKQPQVSFIVNRLSWPQVRD